MDAAGGSVAEGVGDAAAVTDDVKSLVAALQVGVDLHLHVVELHFHTVEEGIVVGGAGGHFIQGVDHLNDTVQDALGKHQTQITGRCVEGGGQEAALHAAGGRAPAPDQVAEALDDDAAAQHIAQPRDGLAVAITVLEGLGEVLGDQEGEIGILGLLGGILIAVAVDGDDTVGILIDHGALGVHAEGADLVAIGLGAVDDLALIELVGKMGKDRGRQLHPDADVHTVAFRGDLKVPADLLHPLGADPAHADDALVAGEGSILGVDSVALPQLLHRQDRGIEEEGHLILQVVIEIFQDDIVDIGAQMADGSVQQMQIVLDAEGLEPGAGGGIELGALAAVGHIDAVDIVHQVQGLLLADVFVEGAAEIVGDVVLAVGEGARTAETAHDRAALAADAGFDLISVDGAAAFAQSMAGFKYSHLQLRLVLHQLVGGENTAGAGTDNDHIILHR